MKFSLAIKIIFYIIIFFFLINGWWFVALPLIIFGIWKLGFMVEVLIAGVMYDALFGMVSNTGVWGYTGIITVVIILIGAYILKKIVR